jgi:putative FmdB family regulatory protein
MPIYDYFCPACGPFEERRPMSESQASVSCAICLSTAVRMPAAPRLNLMSSNNRIAESRNEKSAHEPGVVHRLAANDAHAHGGNGHHRHSHAHAHAHAPHPSPRPWMLGH